MLLWCLTSWCGLFLTTRSGSGANLCPARQLQALAGRSWCAPSVRAAPSPRVLMLGPVGCAANPHSRGFWSRVAHPERCGPAVNPPWIHCLEPRAVDPGSGEQVAESASDFGFGWKSPDPRHQPDSLAPNQRAALVTGSSCRLELASPSSSPQSHLKLPPAYPKIKSGLSFLSAFFQGKMVSEELALASSLAKPGALWEPEGFAFRISSTLDTRFLCYLPIKTGLLCCSISLFLSPIFSWLSMSASLSLLFSTSHILLSFISILDCLPTFPLHLHSLFILPLPLDYAHICKHLNLRLGVFSVCFLLRCQLHNSTALIPIITSGKEPANMPLE